MGRANDWRKRDPMWAQYMRICTARAIRPSNHRFRKFCDTMERFRNLEPTTMDLPTYAAHRIDKYGARADQGEGPNYHRRDVQ